VLAFLGVEDGGTDPPADAQERTGFDHEVEAVVPTGGVAEVNIWVPSRGPAVWGVGVRWGVERDQETHDSERDGTTDEHGPPTFGACVTVTTHRSPS
jgi:hypothetical protein